MKDRKKSVLIGIMFLAVIGFVLFTTGPRGARACGTGTAGGQDYVPQRRGPAGPLAQRSALTLAQAREILTAHVRRLNPNLKVGQVNDAGSYYAAEILSDQDELVQRMAVDKLTGRLMFIN